MNLLKFICYAGLVLALTTPSHLVAEFSLDSSSWNSHQEAALEKYGLEHPHNWDDASSAVKSLKSLAGKLEREGKSKASMSDHRSALDGRYTSYSGVRREGERLLDEAEKMQEEAVAIEQVIQGIKKQIATTNDALTPMREWTSQDGERNIHARVISVSKSGTLLVHRKDGAVFSYPKTSLSEQDAIYLEGQMFLNSYRHEVSSYEREQLSEAFHEAGSAAQREWSFIAVDLTLEGRIVRDEGVAVILGVSDGNFYTIPLDEFSEETREQMEQDKLLASFRMKAGAISSRLEAMTKADYGFQMEDWKVSGLNLPITGRLIDFDNDKVLILNAANAYFELPLLKLDSSHEAELELARFILTNRLIPGEREREQLSKAFHEAGAEAQREWNFVEFDLTLEGRIVREKGNTLVVGVSDDEFYSLSLDEFTKEIRESLKQARLLASLRVTGGTPADHLHEGVTGEYSFDEHSWNIIGLSDPIHGKLINIVADTAIIMASGEEYYEVPIEHLSETYLKEIEYANAFLKRELVETQFHEFNIHLFGDGESENFLRGNSQESLNLWIAASELGSTDAMLLLGWCSVEGINVSENDEQETLYWFNKAVEAGNPSGMMYMGLFYEIGIAGVEQNQDEAANWYRKAAQAGHLHGLYLLGSLYGDHQSEAYNDQLAAEAFLEAADAGHVRAAFTIGVYYLEGIGVKKDAATGLSWLLKGAELGDLDAMTLLGTCYMNGIGCARDSEKGIHWLIQSAKLGDAKANKILHRLESEERKLKRSRSSRNSTQYTVASNQITDKDLLKAGLEQDTVNRAHALVMGTLRR